MRPALGWFDCWKRYRKYSAPDSKMGWSLSPGMFFATNSPRRSLWPILPNTRPSGEKIPSMAHTEPLGLAEMSMEGTPSRPTYWVAICPLAVS